MSDVQNVYHRPKHMNSDDIAKVCGKSSRICCSATFSSRMVFGFKLSLLNICSIALQTLVVKWLKSNKFGGHLYFTMKWAFK